MWAAFVVTRGRNTRLGHWLHWWAAADRTLCWCTGEGEGGGGGVGVLWLVILKISSQLPPPLALLTPLRLCWVVGPPGRPLLWLPCQWNPWQEFSWCLFICRSNGNYCSGRAVKERMRTDRRGQLNMYCVWFPVLSNFLALCCKSDAHAKETMHKLQQMLQQCHNRNCLK